jgi:hypothetical protein
MKTALRILALSLAAALPCSAAAQDPCLPCYRTVNRIVYEEEPFTAYRVEYETVLEQREITESRPVYETELRKRTVRVAKPVVETATRQERYFTLKPVYETEEVERAYDRTTWETVTEMRQDRVIVQRPVVETQMHERQHVVRRPVQETVWQDQAYTALTPVTTMRTQLVDQGGFVDMWNYVPGRSQHSLRWMPRGYSTSAVTGETYYRRGGLAWVPSVTPGTYTVSRAYVPNIVAQQVPVTAMMPQTVVQKVPLNVTRYQDEVVTEQVPVQVQRMEQVEEIRETPVTYQRPKVERIVEKIPVQKVRYEREEHVRQVPYEVRRIEYEDREEEYPVQVLRWETEKKVIEVPVQRRKLVPYTSYRLVPRVLTMRLPYDAPVIIDDGTIIRRETSRIVLPPASSRREVQRPANGTKNGSTKAEAKKEEAKPEEWLEELKKKPAEPSDQDPTGQPKLNGEPAKEKDLKVSPPAGSKSNEPAPAKPASGQDGKMARR